MEESVGTAVDDRRHGEVTHLAKAISVRDLRDQVQAKCPDRTPIPCESWIRLQFWPKTQHAKSRIHYTGKIDVHFMVQARQFRKTHPDPIAPFPLGGLKGGLGIRLLLSVHVDSVTHGDLNRYFGNGCKQVSCSSKAACFGYCRATL